MGMIHGISSSFQKTRMSLSKKPEHKLDYYLYTGKEATAMYFWKDKDTFDNSKKVEYLKKKARKLYKLGKLDTLLKECDKDVKNEIIADIMQTFRIDSIAEFWDSIKDVSGEKFREGLEGIKNSQKRKELCKKYVMEARSADDIKALIEWAQNNLSYEESVELWHGIASKKDCNDFFQSISKQAIDKGDFQSLAEMWCTSPKEIQSKDENKKIFQILMESSQPIDIFDFMHDSMAHEGDEYYGLKKMDAYHIELWSHTCDSIQKDKFKLFFESLKNKEAIIKAWEKTKETVKTPENRENLLNIIQQEPNMIVGLIAADKKWIEGKTKDHTIEVLSNEENAKKMAKLFGCKKEQVKDNIDAMLKIAQVDHTVLSVDTRLFQKNTLTALGDNPTKQAAQLKIMKDHPEIAERMGDFATSRNSEAKLKVFGKLLERYQGETNKEDWFTMADRAMENITKNRKLMKDIQKQGIDKVPMEQLEAFMSSGMDVRIDSIDDLKKLDQKMKEKCDKDIQSISLRKRRNAVLYKTFGVSIDDADAMLKQYRRGEKELSQEALDSITDPRVKSYVQCLDAIMQTKDKEALESLYQGKVGVVNKAPKKMKEKVRESFEEALPEIVKKEMEDKLNNRYSSFPKQTIAIEGGTVDVRKMDKNLRVLIADTEELKKDEDRNAMFVNGQNVKGVTARGKVYVAYAKDAMVDDSLDVSDNNMPVAKVKKDEAPKYVVVFADDKETLKKAKEVAEENKRKGGKPLEIVLVDKEKCAEKQDKTNFRTNKIDLEQNAKGIRTADITRVMRSFVKQQDKTREDMDRD